MLTPFVRKSDLALFTAIAPEIAGRLDRLISELRPPARIHWSPAANLHMDEREIEGVGIWEE